MKILLVEDDELVAEVLKKALIAQHYLVDLAADGQEGWELAEAFEYDLILLDLMLPKLDGLSFCKQRRAIGDRTPIVILTGQDTSTSKVISLDTGADDYIIKPFDVQELLARIRALLRRGSSNVTPVLEWDALRLDPSNCHVTYNEQLLHLTAKEYGLLELFLRNTQRIFSQSALLDHLWSFEEPPSENTVRAHIKSLRQKLKKAGAASDLLETVYGLGYRLKPREGKVSQPSAQSQVARDVSRQAPQKAEIVGTTRLDSKSATTSQISPELIVLWERSKDKYRDRINILDQAVTALVTDTLSEELRQQAQMQAHTLLGSLGSFGLMDASRLSRKIEQAFQTPNTLNQTEKEQLSKQVLALRQVLEQPMTPVESVETVPETKLHQPMTIEPKPRLLVVDDDVALALALVSEASSWGIQADIASNLSKARETLAHLRPDVVLLDLCFPESAENGFDLLTELTLEQPSVPVVVFTAQESFTQRVKVARLGGRGFLQKPVTPAQAMEAIAQVLQQSSQTEAKLLLVDDDPQLLDVVRTLLEPWGFNLTLLDNPQEFWDTLEKTAPDLLILDVEMPELSGIDLCQVVRNDPRWSELPVLFLSARTDIETIQSVFTVGADDYVSKPIVGPELVARILNRLERTKILRKLRKFIG
ncbi:response regulator [Allocoleopsis franciscana]|uniref:Response regulator with CheY-like receiver domain and winged-helix DNA-binding domain n=1 Tax=Allocoleopsis franciscana PCC 7113 TaxID=1173027 RepID=K9WCA1_9CYAN|nr:response regulator [Allocoleopsis franciscana]AFZ17868.1 response regulator with CheY-like receiver domain and winged-helix DNA-binding domain [Allocoleopsis franciscana PCC 7113]